MTQAPARVAGLPIWVDVSSPDLEKSKEFYIGLFGWTAFSVPDPAAGGYGFFQLDGKAVAGFGPTFDPSQPPVWNHYVGTTDADETLKKVAEAGGTIVMPAMDVMGQGRMAVFQDPTGAFCSLWQTITMGGAELFNVPGAFSWSELSTRDIAGAKDFYPKVFGWGVKDSPDGSYTEWQIEGRSIAGGMQMTPDFPAQVPPYWLLYFNVSNAQESVDKATALGGKVVMGPMDSPQGPFAVLQDPVGAVFAVIAFQG